MAATAAATKCEINWIYSHLGNESRKWNDWIRKVIQCTPAQSSDLKCATGSNKKHREERFQHLKMN